MTSSEGAGRTWRRGYRVVDSLSHKELVLIIIIIKYLNRCSLYMFLVQLKNMFIAPYTQSPLKVRVS